MTRDTTSIFITLLLLQLLWPAISDWSNRPRAGVQVSAHFDGKLGSLQYLIYLPDGYGNTEQTLSLLLSLHGSGQRGHDLEKVRRCGPAAIVDSGNPLPMIVVSPQCSEGDQWQPELLLELLNKIKSQYAVDSDRIYLTGYSMGGFGGWQLAVEQPTRFAAVAPLCGGGDRHWEESLATIPIWDFHGEKDETVVLEHSQIMVDAIKFQGGSIKLTTYPDEGQGIRELVYGNAEVYAWLLKQHR